MRHTEFQRRHHKTSHEWWFSGNKTKVLRPENRRPHPRWPSEVPCKRRCVRNRQPGSTLHTSSCVHTSGCLWSISQQLPLSPLSCFYKTSGHLSQPCAFGAVAIVDEASRAELSSRLPGHVVLVRGIRLLWSKRVGERKGEKGESIQRDQFRMVRAMRALRPTNKGSKGD